MPMYISILINIALFELNIKSASSAKLKHRQPTRKSYRIIFFFNKICKFIEEVANCAKLNKNLAMKINICKHHL